MSETTSRVDDPSVRFVSVNEAAKYLGIVKSTAYDAILKTGKLGDDIRVVKVGRRYLVPTADLRAAAGI